MIDQSQEHDLVYSKDTSFYDPQCLNKQSNALISPVVSLRKCVDSIKGKQRSILTVYYIQTFQSLALLSIKKSL